MAESRDSVAIHVESLLQILSKSSRSSPTIFKVDDHLRRVNEKAYDPEILAIGPIHRGTERVKDMEQQKVRYLKQLLRRKDKLTVDNYVMELRQLEQKARQCYTQSIQLDRDEFVAMLLLDGCFVIELIRKYWFEELRDKNDYIFQFEQTLAWLRHDLMLFENQIPFFVLEKLFDMTKMEDPDDNMIRLVLLFVEDMFPWCKISPADISRFETETIHHLLGLVYKCYFSHSMIDSKRKINESPVNINSVSELKSAGIRLKCGKGMNKPLYFSFTDGAMKLPRVNISDKTESLLRNLIAYEQCLPNDHPKYVTDYAFFMHCLVNSQKDAELLRRCGIISNWLGDDEMVYLMFNRLGKNVLRSSDFSYSDVFQSVNSYCRLRHKAWMANLKQNYFNSPWAFISFLAAAVLLLLTSIQTVFSVLSYFYKK